MRNALAVVVAFLAAAAVTLILTGPGSGPPPNAPPDPLSAHQTPEAPSPSPQPQPDATQTEAGMVIVEVTDSESAKPVAQARVKWQDKQGTTNADGQLVIQGLPAGTRMQVDAAGYQTETLTTSGASCEPLLLHRAMVHLSVVDASSLEPCRAARVTLDGKPVALKDGMAMIPLPRPGERTVEATLSGYRTYRRTCLFDKNTTLLEVGLEPYRVEGVVTDADTGALLAGVKVRLLGHTTTTDKGGGYVFSGLPGMEKLALAGDEKSRIIRCQKKGYKAAAAEIPRANQKPKTEPAPRTALAWDLAVDIQMMKQTKE